MFKKRMFLVVLLVLMLGVGGLSAQSEPFSRTAMLQHLGEGLIVPVHERLAESALGLRTAVDALRERTEADTLLAAQTAWQTLMEDWRQASLFALGRQTRVLHAALESDVPPLIDYIEVLIADASIRLDADFLRSQGSNMAGVGALEYLLFGLRETPDALVTRLRQQPRRLEYLSAAAAVLEQSAQDLLNYWLPEGDHYLETFIESDSPDDVRESISMLVNAMIGGVENMNFSDIAIPLGLATGQPAPDLIRTPYSDYTLPLMAAYLRGVRIAFVGDAEVGESLGIDDYLDSIGAQRDGTPLSQVILSQLDQALRSIESLSMTGVPLRVQITENVEGVNGLYGDIRTFYLLLKTDAVSQMGLTLTYDDRDGD